MSFPTTPVFLTNFTNGWEDGRAHPALAWLEKCTKAFDSRESWSTPYSDWHTDDYTYVLPNGEATTGGEPAFKATQGAYSAFSSSRHEPKFACVWEAQNGWQVVGEAIVFGDFGGAGTGEESKKVEDTAGRKWDLGVPGMFRFEIVQVQGAKHDGIKMKRLQAYCDNAPLIAEMGKRGIVKSDDTLVSKK